MLTFVLPSDLVSAVARRSASLDMCWAFMPCPTTAPAKLSDGPALLVSSIPNEMSSLVMLVQALLIYLAAADTSGSEWCTCRDDRQLARAVGSESGESCDVLCHGGEGRQQRKIADRCKVCLVPGSESMQRCPKAVSTYVAELERAMWLRLRLTALEVKPAAQAMLSQPLSEAAPSTCQAASEYEHMYCCPFWAT